MGTDYFEIKGRGIIRLEEKLHGYLEEEDDYAAYDMIDRISTKHYDLMANAIGKPLRDIVKLKALTHDPDEDKCAAPGACLYVPQDIIDVLELTDEQCDGCLSQMLDYVLRELEANHDTMEEAGELVGHPAGCMEFVKAYAGKVYAAGAFY